MLLHHWIHPCRLVWVLMLVFCFKECSRGLGAPPTTGVKNGLFCGIRKIKVKVAHAKWGKCRQSIDLMKRTA